MLAQQLGRHLLDGVPLLDEMSCLGDDEAEHGDGWCIGRDRQGDRGLGGVVDVAEQTGLGDLAAGDVPGGGDEGLLAEGGDAGRHGKTLEKGEEPVAAGVVPEAVNLWEVERQVVRLDAVENLGLALETTSWVIDSSWMSLIP